LLFEDDCSVVGPEPASEDVEDLEEVFHGRSLLTAFILSVARVLEPLSIALCFLLPKDFPLSRANSLQRQCVLEIAEHKHASRSSTTAITSRRFGVLSSDFCVAVRKSDLGECLNPNDGTDRRTSDACGHQPYAAASHSPVHHRISYSLGGSAS
jgi:hypothetical protein